MNRLAVTDSRTRLHPLRKRRWSMQPDGQRSIWEDRAEAVLPIAGALAALGVMLMILAA